MTCVSTLMYKATISLVPARAQSAVSFRSSHTPYHKALAHMMSPMNSRRTAAKRFLSKVIDSPGRELFTAAGKIANWTNTQRRRLKRVGTNLQNEFYSSRRADDQEELIPLIDLHADLPSEGPFHDSHSQQSRRSSSSNSSIAVATTGFAQRKKQQTSSKPIHLGFVEESSSHDRRLPDLNKPLPALPARC